MLNKKKWVAVTLFGVLALAVGGFLSYNTSAGNHTKAEKHQILKEQFELEKTKLESGPMPQSKAEIEVNVKQGQKVKEIGLEAGKLEAELYPPDQKKQLEADILSLKGALAESVYFKSYVNDPQYGKAYQKAIEIVEIKKQRLDKIEKDFIENNRSIEELTKELNEVRAIKVFD